MAACDVYLDEDTLPCLPLSVSQEVERLVRLLIRFYSPHAHHHVEAFNLKPDKFDLQKLLQETPRD